MQSGIYVDALASLGGRALRIPLRWSILPSCEFCAAKQRRGLFRDPYRRAHRTRQHRAPGARPRVAGESIVLLRNERSSCQSEVPVRSR